MKKGVARISTENTLRELREKLLVSKSELARRSGLSIMTLDRIEKGKPCRLDTKRKIVKALGFNPWLNNDRTSSANDRKDDGKTGSIEAP